MTSVDPGAEVRTPRRLAVLSVDFLGGDRTVEMRRGFNIVYGNITTGKTTYVRLLRSLLGTVPSDLPLETEAITDIRAIVDLGEKSWAVNRPLTTTRSAPVDVASLDDRHGDEQTLAFRLPAVGSQASFGRFLLDQLDIPAVSVPQARSKPTEGLTPVTMTDWLGYCIVTGDEIDSQVFGHHHPFRDQKRRWVFELAYGLYDAEVARLAAELRRIENKISALEREAELQAKFLAETPFSDRAQLHQRMMEIDEELRQGAVTAAESAQRIVVMLNVGDLRTELLQSRAEARRIEEEIRRNEGQLVDLEDLRKQLKSQFSRLTRAVISDEWLVDFDFVVCPRCGSDVSPARASHDHCYLCLQPPRPSNSRESFMAEQDRIIGQIQETETVIASREKSLDILLSAHEGVAQREAELATQLDTRTIGFVSDGASRLQESAIREAYLIAEKHKCEDYLQLLDRFSQTAMSVQDLEERKADIEDAIARRELSVSTAEENVQALEAKMLAFLQRLGIPGFDDGLTLKINRKTYLPEINGRSFDELSSQGLKTLVNVAHSLAHHTVAIDRSLPLPGFLVLDGLSANAGRRGFDEERILAMYRLLLDVAEEYGDQLQMVAVDNDPPMEIWDELEESIVLHLTQDDKLVRA